MSDTASRRFYYRVALKLMALVMAAFAFLMVLSGLFGGPDTDPSESLVVDLSAMAPGELRIVSWAGREVLILRRSAGMDAADTEGSGRLYDPASRWSLQPAGARNSGRTLVPGYFIAYARGTDLSCPLDPVPPEAAAQEGWGGGFADRCRGSRYDFAGRVYDGQPARRNLEVPDYRVEGTRLILGG